MTNAMNLFKIFTAQVFVTKNNPLLVNAVPESDLF
jgi:hypothetical protein